MGSPGLEVPLLSPPSPPCHPSEADPRTCRISLYPQIPEPSPRRTNLSFGAGLWGLAASHLAAARLGDPITPNLCFWEGVAAVLGAVTGAEAPAEIWALWMRRKWHLRGCHLKKALVLLLERQIRIKPALGADCDGNCCAGVSNCLPKALPQPGTIAQGQWQGEVSPGQSWDGWECWDLQRWVLAKLGLIASWWFGFPQAGKNHFFSSLLPWASQCHSILAEITGKIGKRLGQKWRILTEQSLWALAEISFWKPEVWRIHGFIFM